MPKAEGAGVLQCDQCERTFTRAAARGAHRRVHQPKKEAPQYQYKTPGVPSNGQDLAMEIRRRAEQLRDKADELDKMAAQVEEILKD